MMTSVLRTEEPIHSLTRMSVTARSQSTASFSSNPLAVLHSNWNRRQVFSKTYFISISFPSESIRVLWPLSGISAITITHFYSIRLASRVHNTSGVRVCVSAFHSLPATIMFHTPNMLATKSEPREMGMELCDESNRWKVSTFSLNRKNYYFSWLWENMDCDISP